MKEILKSKIMILFMVMVLGVVYTNSLQEEKLEERNSDPYYDKIVIYVK